MYNDDTFPVLLVCADQDRSAGLLSRLYENGFEVTGHASQGASALTLAAQSNAEVALVAPGLSGRRQAEEVADDLMRNWGVASLILGDGVGEMTPVGASWSPPARHVVALRRVLSLDGRE